NLGGERGGQLGLELRHARAGIEDLGIRQLPHGACVEGDGVARMYRRTDRFDAHELTAHAEARHLFASILGDQARLQEPGVYEIERIERLTGPVQVLAGVEFALQDGNVAAQFLYRDSAVTRAHRREREIERLRLRGLACGEVGGVHGGLQRLCLLTMGTSYATAETLGCRAGNAA